MNRQRFLVSLTAILALTVGSDAWAQQYARPTSTPDSAGWTVTPDTSPDHHLAVDEDEQNISDADFVDTTNGNTTPIRFGLNNVADPGADSGHKLHFRCQASTGSKGGSEFCDVALYQNGGLIFQEVGNRVAVRGTYTTFATTIPDLDAADLQVTNGNYENLEIRLTGGSIGNNDAVQYSYAALEVPEATSVPPEVTTLSAQNVTDNDAQLRGEITTDGTPPVHTCGVDWGTTSNGPYDAGSQSVACSGTAPFSFAIDVTDLLTPGTNYWYIAWADNGTREDATNEIPFSTLKAPATVTTALPASVTATTAVLGGDVTNDGGATVTDRGIVWSTTPLPQVGVDTAVQMGTGTGQFSDTVGDLSPASDVALPTGELVYFRAYAINSEGTAYGNERSFTPAGPPQLTALPADNVTLYSGTMHGRLDDDGGNNLTDCGIAWGNDSGGPYPNLKSAWPCTAGEPFNVTLSALPGTTYYYKAYATNDLLQTTLSQEPAVTGGQESFTTPSEPTVQASNVTFPKESGGAMRISWTRGNGTGAIVVMRLDDPVAGQTPRVDPQDGDDYLPSQDFSACPAELPTNSGNCVVYKGTAGGVLVTGLAANTIYSVVVYEYTGTGTSTDYLLADAPLASNAGSHSTTDEPVHNMDYGINCDQCHKHGNFNLIGDAALITVCENCHADGGDAAARREFSNHVPPKDADNGPHPDVTFVACGACHELHNPVNDNTTLSYNVLTDQTTYNKSFLRSNVGKYIPGAVDGAFLHNDQPLRAAGNDSGYPETPFDTPERAVEGGTDAVDPVSATQARGYCQVCHTLTDYHRSSNTAGSDQCHDGQTGNCGPAEAHCGECHEHNDSFKGKGGTTTCMVCHAGETNQGLNTRREVMTEFDSAGSSHITAGSAQILEPDCLVCHAFDESHQQQYVTLYDLDDSPGASPRTLYAQPTDEISAQIPAQGAPLSQHCLSCHGDGTPTYLPTSGSDNTQNSPFINSGGVTGTLVLNGGDTSLWVNAGHNNSATIGCVGCHVGHGSTAASLLDPDPPAFPTGANPSDYDTDFCINCHDADGPSSKDIATKLSYPTETITGINRGFEALMNNRHDVRYDDKQYSGASLECKDCHSPHIDSQSDPVRNPDDGSIVPDYDFCNGSNGIYNYNSSPNGDCSTGSNLDPLNPAGKPNNNYVEPDHIAFCLVCHDGTLPAGSNASMGTNPVLDMQTAYFNDGNTTDKHGIATGNEAGQGYLKFPWTPNGATSDITQGYAALNCTTCHDAHGSGNIFNLRTSITVAGEVMETGGWAGDTIGETQVTEYFLPPNGTEGQDMYYWGAWCSFCHQMESHGRSETQACNTGHKHGGGNF